MNLIQSHSRQWLDCRWPYPVQSQLDAWVALVVLLHSMLHESLDMVQIKCGHVEVSLEVLLIDMSIAAEVPKDVPSSDQTTVLFHQAAEDGLLRIAEQLDLEIIEEGVSPWNAVGEAGAMLTCSS